MSGQTKLTIFLGTLVLALLLSVGLLGKVAWDQRLLSQANSEKNQQLMQANLELGKAQTKFGNAQKTIEQLSKELSDQIRKNEEIIQAYGELKADYDVLASLPPKEIIIHKPGKIITVEKSIHLEPGLYLANSTQDLEHTELMAQIKDHRLDVQLRLWSDKYGIVQQEGEYQLHMKFIAELIKTTTKSGATNFYLNLWETDSSGTKLGKLKVKEFSVTTQDERAPEFFVWAPHLDISGMAGLGKGLKPQWGAAVGFSAMGYGLTENDLQWRFLNASIDIGTSLGLGFAPAQYNLGQLVPLISNLWIGPHLGVNIDQEWYVGGRIGAVL